jgi:hypothetical protein
MGRRAHVPERIVADQITQRDEPSVIVLLNHNEFASND